MSCNALATAPEPLLHRAARLGDDEEIARLIAAGTPPHERGDFLRDHGAFFTGLTPLMVAAGSLDGATAKTLEVLLRLGATLCARSGAGVTAAWYAAGAGLSREPTTPSRPHDRADRLRFLLDEGLDPRECADNGR